MPRSILHAGCGREPLPDWLGDCDETRLDIDPDVQPDIVASLTDMGEIGPFDAIYTCHTLEHLYPFDVPTALREFRKALRPGGIAIVIVPDLEDVRPTEETVYESPAGPVCGLDMYYGMARLIALSPYMAHKCGFVSATLHKAMSEAGLGQVSVTRLNGFNLVGIGVA
jgi:SAM-dependent methyltransferase